MFQIIKQKFVNGIVVDEKFAITVDENEAKYIVQAIRKYQNNQLCYYKQI